MSADPKTQTKPRPLIAAKERGPGPGRYALPSTIGFVRAPGVRSSQVIAERATTMLR